MTNEKTESSGAVWNRLDQQGDLIGELARNQAATEANLAALASSVESGFNQINASLSAFQERQNRPTNWVAIGGLFIVAVGGLLTFVGLRTEPNTEKLAVIREDITGLQVREREDLEMRGYQRAQIEYLERDVMMIDEQGSRRWVQSQPAKE